MSIKLNDHSFWLQIDTTSDITFISQRLWKTLGQPPRTPKRHVTWSASGDCVHITGATMEIDDKTASGKIYIADSRYNQLDLDFIKSLGFLDIPFNSVCNAVSRSPAQGAITDQTNDTRERFSPVFTDDLRRCAQAETSLKHLLHLFSNSNDQNSHGPRYIWILLALSMAVVFGNIPFFIIAFGVVRYKRRNVFSITSVVVPSFLLWREHI